MRTRITGNRDRVALHSVPMPQRPLSTRLFWSLQRARRSGASLVEFAIVAPIFFLVVLALVQFVGLLMSQNVLTAAAREGGRVASLPNTVAVSTVVDAVKERTRRGGISPDLVTVTVTPSVLSSLTSGSELRITVSAPIHDMAWLWAIVPPTGNLTAELTNYKE